MFRKLGFCIQALGNTTLQVRYKKFLSVNALALSNGSLRLDSVMREDRGSTSYQNAMF